MPNRGPNYEYIKFGLKILREGEVTLELAQDDGEVQETTFPVEHPVEAATYALLEDGLTFREVADVGQRRNRIARAIERKAIKAQLIDPKG